METLIVKDMSRFGRNYLEVGRLTETVFPTHDIHFIAVNDGMDNAQGEDDFTPFRNIMNDWYAKRPACSHYTGENGHSTSLAVTQ